MNTAWVGYGLEGALLIAGITLIVLGWGRRGRVMPRYRQWPNSASDVALALSAAIAVVLLGIGVFYSFSRQLAHINRDELVLLSSLVLDGGALLGLIGFNAFYRPIGVARPSADGLVEAAKYGPVTFLVAWPIIVAVMALWQGGLQLIHVSVDQQETVKMFERLDTIGLKAQFFFFAVVLAPCAEELVFRGVIFRGLAKYIPRNYAVWISAALFAALHQDLTSFVPLMILGVIFANAYERTGNLAVTMTAHALFNLNTLVALLLGVTQ